MKKQKENAFFSAGLWIILLLITLLQVSCASSRAYRKVAKVIDYQVESSEIFNKSFTGIAFYDPAIKKMIYTHNADKYFIPASNTKLFTYYAGLMLLGDSVPALKYVVHNDSLIFWGTGDPSFLHPTLQNSTALVFLNNRPEKLFFTTQNHSVEHFGPGWAWDDYNESFSVEKAPFPIYGNYVSFQYKGNDSIPQTSPPYFAQLVKPGKASNGSSGINRDLSDNVFLYSPPADTKIHKKHVPFKYSSSFFVELLSDTLNRKVNMIGPVSTKGAECIYSVPTERLYQDMLLHTDNFIAEQILLLCSSQVADTLDTRFIINYVTKNYLKDLPDAPKWVDGSGLSRYNLFTPRSFVYLLNKIQQEVPEDKLNALLPAGGQSGTLKDWFKAEKPYIFAKTGTLSNNFSLSGFLYTKSGKKLIFSFMNNNYTVSSAEVKKEMEKIFRYIYESY